MKLHKTCPLTSKDCDINCAWNTTQSDNKLPVCAITFMPDIAESLYKLQKELDK
ncbi:hypothetical protein U728_1264 [Clostridium botulinum 202F]|nr:hypothetical protein U728_1264 [Clostridium botulinum 202F]KAI3346962.1 hypothetical protein CIT17_08310 [Clostridium botulinum]MBY6987247.1 hypothetical protein [Clostridium botulinum]